VLFNSFVFLFVFLPIVVIAYFAIPQHRARLVLIVVASYVFYAYAKWWFALLMAASTLVGFVGGRALERNRSKLVLAVTVAALLALLGAFKYAAFVGGNLTSFVGVITAHGFPGLHGFLNGIVLPIGISFYTFEGISYAADVYRGKLPAERNPLRYAYFISFFPHRSPARSSGTGSCGRSCSASIRSTPIVCAPVCCSSRSDWRRRRSSPTPSGPG
jgi:alginate O-acetyltransferase complex protein AlgI